MQECCGNCESCGKCAGSLVLNWQERAVLERLGQIPFLPIARKADSMDPIFFEENGKSVPELTPVLSSLAHKGLLTLDFDLPLKGFHSDAYDAFPIRGSTALTARGQRVLELLEIQGADE